MLECAGRDLRRSRGSQQHCDAGGAGRTLRRSYSRLEVLAGGALRVAVRSGWNEIELNGARQWVSLRGDPDGPVLLFLHGGPGGAEYGPRRHYLGKLEDRWQVVDWEQRGAGRSFHGDESAATLSLDALVADGSTLIDRLREEAGGRPVVLTGHSFGTVLGVLLASKVPEQLAAYVGAAQVVCWSLQETRSYDWALAEARRRGNAKAIAALEGIGPPERGQYAGGTSAVEVQRRWLGSLGGVSGDPGFMTRWLLSISCGPTTPSGPSSASGRGCRARWT